MVLPPPKKQARTDLLARLVLDVGIDKVSKAPVGFTEHDAARHCAIMGGTGGGKSKLTETMIRQARIQGVGCCLIDPHGQTVRQILLSEAAKEKPDERTLHLLEPGPDRLFSFDPFEGLLHPGESPTSLSYRARQAARVDRVVRTVAREVRTADLDAMNRLRRWLTNAFTACSQALDTQGTHLGLSKALILLQPNHPEFPATYARVVEFLPDEIHADFDKLLSERCNPHRQEQWVESSINRLRKILGPLVETIFDQRAPSINFKKIIQNGELLLVNLEETEYLSAEQARVIGDLIICELIATARQIPEGERREFFLFIDEAERHLAEDLGMAVAELRKFKMALVLIFQDLSCLTKGELDLGPKILSQYGIQMTFQQQNPEDVELLAKHFSYASLDLTPLRDTGIARMDFSGSPPARSPSGPVPRNPLQTAGQSAKRKRFRARRRNRQA